MTEMLLKKIQEQDEKIMEVNDRIQKLEEKLLNFEKEDMKEKELKEKVTDILLEFRIFPTYKGFYYLREAILMTMEDPKLVMGAVTKQLYPEIAKRYKTTSYSVEKDLRTAVEVAWRSKKECPIKLLKDRKLTTSEFIAVVADYIARN